MRIERSALTIAVCCLAVRSAPEKGDKGGGGGGDEKGDGKGEPEAEPPAYFGSLTDECTIW
jgi:hypothetical protein